MKSVYFLILNYIQYVPYAYGLLRAYAEQNPIIRENYDWKEPFCAVDPVDDIVDQIIDPDILLCSNYVWNAAGTVKDAAVSSNHGWLMGVPTQQKISDSGGMYPRLFNSTSLRYPPNTTQMGMAGVGNNDGQNNGIYSAHPGGVMGALVDGSARYFSETMDMYTLRLLCNRKDGQPITF